MAGDHLGVDRVALTAPPTRVDLDELAQRITTFHADWQQTAEPIDWRYTRRDLNDVLNRLNQRDHLARSA